jgi:hypothetical protein
MFRMLPPILKIMTHQPPHMMSSPTLYNGTQLQSYGHLQLLYAVLTLLIAINLIYF